MKIFMRSDPLVFAELFDKVAVIIEAAVVCHCGEAVFILTQQGTGSFNAVVIQVVNGGTVGDALEKAAEIFWRHAHLS